MYHKQKLLGLILGEGLITKTLINNCKKKKIKTFIIAIENNYNIKYGKPDLILNYNKIGNIFKFLKAQDISQVIFLGKIKKKKLLKFRPDFITLFYLAKLLFDYNKGDSKIIDKIARIFIKKKINIIDPRELLKDNLCDKTYNYLYKKNKTITLTKIKEYFRLAKEFGKKDLGQSVIVVNNHILFSENEKGTDYLIKRFTREKISEPAFLVKVSKPEQNLKIDLPTIGPTTILNIINSGLNGLIVENKKTLVENPALTFKLIKDNNLLYYAI